MRRASFVVSLVLLAARAAAAQEPEIPQTPTEPTIVLTFYAGAVTGHDLWAIGRQPLCQNFGTGSCSGQYDTVALGRDVGASLAAGVTAVYFPRSALGFEFDVSYLGLPLENHCILVSSGVSAENQGLCESIAQGSLAMSALSFEAGVIVRTPSSASRVRPYARAGVGVLTYSGSTVEVEGFDSLLQGTKIVIDDPSPTRTSASLFGGVGLMANLSPGYVFRLEARDVYARLKRVVGPADDLGIAPTSSRFYHHIALTLGLGVVLEHKRGRRY